LLATVLTAITSVGLLLPSVLFARKEVLSQGKVPLTEKERATYIEARIPEYRALAIANAAPSPVYALFGEGAAYYSEGLFMGDYFGPGRYSQVMDSFKDGGTLYSTLHRLGATYFLVTLRDKPWMPPFPNDVSFDQHFELLFADSSAELYRIHESPLLGVVARPNLLRNAGFDELYNKWPVSWRHFGNPVVGKTKDGPFSGSNCIKVTDTDGFEQQVRITPGEIY